MPTDRRRYNLHDDTTLEELILKTTYQFELFRKVGKFQEPSSYFTRVVKLYRAAGQNCFRPNHRLISPAGQVWGMQYHIPYRQVDFSKAGLPAGWSYFYSHGGDCLKCGRTKSTQKREHGHCGVCSCSDCLAGDDDLNCSSCGKVTTDPYGFCSDCNDEMLAVAHAVHENDAALKIQKAWRHYMSDKWYDRWLDRIALWIIERKDRMITKIENFKLNPEASVFLPKSDWNLLTFDPDIDSRSTTPELIVEDKPKRFYKNTDPRRRGRGKKVADGECYLHLFFQEIELGFASYTRQGSLP
jgi:hypothetical protein